MSYINISLTLTAILINLCLLSPGYANSGTYQISGYFDSASNTWDRRMSTPLTIGPDCDTVSSPSYNTNVRYTQYEIIPTLTQLLVAQISASDENIDTMMALYCEPLNPNDPGENLIAMDDDGNGYPNPSLTGRNILLEQGKSYYLVVTSYSNYNPNGGGPPDGGYTLEIEENYVHRHSLRDAIAALETLSGEVVPRSTIAPLSDIPCYCPQNDQRITLGQVIRILNDLSN